MLLKSVRGYTPSYGSNCFFAENATLIGDVILGDEVSVWYPFKASQNGYCKFHEHQGDNIESRRLSSGGANGHNHGPERMNVAGCPACERGRKGLIDLNTLVFNQ